MKRFKMMKAYLVFTLLLGVFILPGCGGETGNGHWDNPPSPLASLAITPAASSIPITGFQQYTATATYEDGSSAEVTTTSLWSSASTAVATVAPSTGVAIGVNSGTSDITATFGGKSATVILTVNTATLSSIQVTPTTATIPVNGIQKFAVIAIWSNGSTADVTASSALSSGSPLVATILPSGSATGKSVGDSIITAQYPWPAVTGTLSATATLTVNAATLMSLRVTPATASIPVNGTQKFAVIATWSNQTSTDVTASSSLVSGSPLVATISLTGLATGKANGVSTITAKYPWPLDASTKTATATLTVNSATLKSIMVTPATATIPVTGTQKYTVIATWSNQTSTNVTASSSLSSGSPLVATILPSGVATGDANGIAIITAKYPWPLVATTKTATATLNVVSALRPTVLSTIPVTTIPGPTLNVLIDTEISATFDKVMDATTITANTFTMTKSDLTPVAGNLIPVTYDPLTKTVAFHPLAALETGTTYVATIKGTGINAATDSTGNALAGDATDPSLAADYVWSFTTADSIIPPATDLLAKIGIAAYGGITNSGTTKINGDVVLNPNATCNLQPILPADGPGFGVCGGNEINIPTNNVGDLVITPEYPDTTTAIAITAALHDKWLTLSPAIIQGGTVLGCGTIGNAGDAGALIGCSGNATLPPGTYISATNSTIGIAGDLTLDAAGNANAVWVFQAPTALDMEVGSQIILAGGAKASNIWWYVGSSATLKTTSVFNGNILASASISMQQDATSCGRLLAGAEGSGAFTFISNIVSVPGHPNAPADCQ